MKWINAEEAAHKSGRLRRRPPMNHKRWQAVVMIAFSWIMWVRVMDSSPKSFLNQYLDKSEITEYWEIIDGYESKKLCREARLQGKLPGYRGRNSLELFSEAIDFTKKRKIMYNIVI